MTFSSAPEKVFVKLTNAQELLADKVSDYKAKYKESEFGLTAWLFLRLVGIIFLCAFISFWVQAMTLIGSSGILPLTEFIDTIHSRIGDRAYWRFPMIFWLSASDATIHLTCFFGCVFSILLTANILPRLSAFMIYLLYLSLFYAGQRFLGFQWDLFLIEVGFLSLLLCLSIRPGIWLLRWLMFRFMFLSGMVKIMSGDETWRNLTALNYHFETQPLPTPLAYYAHHMPQTLLSFSTSMTLVIELIIPFFIFCPRPIRLVAAGCFLILQTVIILTGNYNFFNLLAIALCLILLDDYIIKKLLPSNIIAFIKKKVSNTRPHKYLTYIVCVLGFITILASTIQFYQKFVNTPAAPFRWVTQTISPLQLVNSYGPFSVMTTTRPEIIIEGSDDGETWKEYQFKYKPSDPESGTRWNIPHQPRIDWQLWFAAMDIPQRNPWFMRFMVRILEHEKDVIYLFKHNPFPNQPPKYVRALLYDYSFADKKERKQQDLYWHRERRRIYVPPMHLEVPQQ